MQASIEQILAKFLQHKKVRNRSNSCWSSGEKLFSYETIMAEHSLDTIHINNTIYSSTTTRIRNKLVYLLDTAHIIYHNNIKRGADFLIDEK